MTKPITEGAKPYRLHVTLVYRAYIFIRADSREEALDKGESLGGNTILGNADPPIFTIDAIEEVPDDKA